MPDYIPTKEGDLVTWLTNYSNKIAIIGPTMGMTPDEVAAEQNAANLLKEDINNADAATAAQKAATATKNTRKTTSLKQIRGTVAHLKTNKLWTDANSKDLQTDSTTGGLDPGTFKAEASLKLTGGHVQITFVKGGIEGMNIYARLKGAAQFVFLAHATHSPYVDARPLAQAGVAEIREYQLMGELNDTEIGQPSDVLSITFG